MQFRISSGLFLVLILGAAAVAQAQSAPVLISPSASDPPLPADVTFSWSPVTSATAYYLYVGTTVGAKDIVNTGELATTSYSGSNLPPGITLYIRTWAKVGGHWSVYSDTQSQTSLAARVIRPVAGTQDLPTSLQFIWQRISGAQAYYLYVGTSLGAKDIVNTGELAGTSFN